MSEQVQELVDKINKNWELFKEKDAQRNEEIKQYGEALGDTKEQLEKIETDMDEMRQMRDQLTAIESKLDRPGAGGGEVSPEQHQYKEAWTKWMRSGGIDKRAESEMQDLIEQKAVTVGTDSAGGYAVPEEISRMIENKVLEISPLRGLVTVESTSSGDYKKLVNERGTASGWAGEGDTRSETGTPTLAEVAPTFGELYAVPKASNWSLQDMFFDVEQWLINEVAEEFAYQEGVAVISGNGTSKPTGLTGATPENTADDASPRRTAGVLEYIKSGVAAGLPTHDPTGSPIVNAIDKFIDMQTALKSPYKANARWLANRSTLATMRKYKDVDQNYLWQPSVMAGQPDIFLGYPVNEMEAVADVAANAFPVMFGDFRRGYILVDRVGISMIRDDVTSKGHTQFYVSRRMGGKILNDEAIKLMKCEA